MDAREAAEQYQRLGWYPIPLRPRSKACKDEDWRRRIYEPAEFDPGDNVGLRLMNAADKRLVKLVAVDLDCPEAVEMAWDFLPPAPAWGRPGKDTSQVLYDCPVDKAIAIKDGPDTVIELRADHQSMAPPSAHPDGGRLEWRAPGPRLAPKMDQPALVRVVRLLATGAIVKRRYAPEGARHEWCLALAGSLRQLGLNEEESTRVLRAAMRGKDAKPEDRLAELRTTYARPADGKLAGLGRLAELGGEELPAALRAAWGHQEHRPRARNPANEPDAIAGALEKLGVRLRRDTFAGRDLARAGDDGRWELADDHWMKKTWLDVGRVLGARPTTETFVAVVEVAARASPWHPVREWLSSLKWDGTKRLEEWLINYGDAHTQDRDYLRAVSALPLVAAVRRVRQPGAKFDELLVLESGQGKGKSSALLALCKEEDWFSDDLPLAVDSKQVIERTAGKWVVEAAELMNMRRAQVEGLKAMLSRRIDGPVRLAYGRASVEVPRQFVIVGTTNSFEYLQDSTGNRRFWPVRCGAFDLVSLAKDRDQLWAEAAAREAEGASIRLDPSLWGHAAKQQESRQVTDPWEEELASRWGHDGYRRLTNDDVWDAVKLPLERRDRGAAFRLTEVMQKLGYFRTVVRRGKKNFKGWGRDGEKQGEIEADEGAEGGNS